MTKPDGKDAAETCTTIYSEVPKNYGTWEDQEGGSIGGGTTIALPTGGGDIKPNENGTAILPSGSKVQTVDGGTIEIPEGGAITSSGEVKKFFTVTFDLQGGSAVSSQTVTAGSKAVKPAYPPKVEQPSISGTVTVVPGRPSAGEKVTIQPKPDDGYEVSQITFTDKNGKPVAVTENPDGTYTFIQPSGKLKIEVSYQPVEVHWNDPHWDIPEAAWYYDAVRFVSVNGLMNGYGDGRFGPADDLSRAQLAQILYNLEGQPDLIGTKRFTDVADDAWYADAITWAAAQGVVGGYGNGLFRPGDNITREQFPVVLWRYAGSPAATDKELLFSAASWALFEKAPNST